MKCCSSIAISPADEGQSLQKRISSLGDWWLALSWTFIPQRNRTASYWTSIVATGPKQIDRKKATFDTGYSHYHITAPKMCDTAHGIHSKQFTEKNNPNTCGSLYLCHLRNNTGQY